MGWIQLGPQLHAYVSYVGYGWELSLQLHAYVFYVGYGGELNYMLMCFVGYGWELGAQLHAVREGEQEGLRRLGGSGNNSYKQLSCTVSTLKSDIYETENFEPQ